MIIKLSKCETIVDESKFLEVHKIRAEIGGAINQPFIDRLEKYYKIKDNGNKRTKGTV